MLYSFFGDSYRDHSLWVCYNGYNSHRTIASPELSTGHSFFVYIIGTPTPTPTLSMSSDPGHTSFHA